jgi:hypothetical protein
VGARRAFGVAAATAVVGAGTAVNRLLGVPLSSFASSPRLVGEGRVWLLLTSGVLADNPWLPSLAGFAVALAVASWVLPGHVVVSAAAAGQVLSALLVYGGVGLVRLLDPRAFGSVVGQSDFGLSAVIAAWIGAVAGVYWGRDPSARGRTMVVLGCLCCLGVGLAFRPHLTFLDSEHIVAFAIGAALVSPAWRAMLAPARRLAAVAAAAAFGANLRG